MSQIPIEYVRQALENTLLGKPGIYGIGITLLEGKKAVEILVDHKEVERYRRIIDPNVDGYDIVIRGSGPIIAY